MNFLRSAPVIAGAILVAVTTPVHSQIDARMLRQPTVSVDWQWPPVAHQGPQAMLINGWSGSGGDAFPFYFKKAGLGPLIGRRTWGGLIGISGTPALVDRGSVTAPTFAIYSTEGEWIIEGHGVEPDIDVVDDPALMAKGVDPQLERGIQEVMSRIEKAPKRPKPPVYTKRIAGESSGGGPTKAPAKP